MEIALKLIMFCLFAIGLPLLHQLFVQKQLTKSTLRLPGSSAREQIPAQKPTEPLHMVSTATPSSQPMPDAQSGVSASPIVPVHDRLSTRYCVSCGTPITPEVSSFCLSQPDRFGGLTFCDYHQRYIQHIQRAA